MPAYYSSEDYISHSDSSKGIINRLYQKVRKTTLRNKRRMIEKETGLTKGTLLDVGSGTGSFLYEMRSHDWQVTGIEPDKGARAVAKKSYDLELIEEKSLFDLPSRNFDVITLWHVLEHVHDLHGYLQQLRSLLRDEGTMIIAVPNYTSGDASVYKEFWAAYDVPRHLYHFSPGSMKTLMDKHALEIKEHKPMWYDSFYISLLSSKYKKGKPGFISGFWNGLSSNLKAMVNVQKCSSLIYIIRK
jgi:2-polyprenyl-3-methyl-5-hydroxy-6-metoxy-1,4-benzoquinol methylase